MPRVTIVVPCFNEAQRLNVVVLREFARENAAITFLLVNDGSTDATGEVLEQLHRGDPDSFSVCDLPVNAGKAEAVRQGLLRAFREGPEYVGYWDADLATPLESILTFHAVLDSRPDIDMVFGARVCLLGRSVERRPLRHYLGRMFATAASAALGVGFYDTQCGAKLFRVSPELASAFETPFLTCWIFDVEMIARLIFARRGSGRPRIDQAVYEYPLHIWRDVAGFEGATARFRERLLRACRHPLELLDRSRPQSAYAFGPPCAPRWHAEAAFTASRRPHGHGSRAAIADSAWNRLVVRVSYAEPNRPRLRVRRRGIRNSAEATPVSRRGGGEETGMTWRRAFGLGVPDIVFGFVLMTVLIGDRTGVLSDPGTFWHARLGREIVRTGDVTLDRFAHLHVRDHVPWVDQSWGFDLGLAALFELWGWSFDGCAICALALRLRMARSRAG